MLTRSRCCRTLRRRSGGLSMVEMLVGIVVGLFLVGGALRFFADYLDDNRRLLLETRISQDLRTVADLIVRDLRRAGYWSAPNPGVTAPADPNPYAGITLTGNPATDGRVQLFARCDSKSCTFRFRCKPTEQL